ncbi:MAG TPA: cysteine synthase B [Candidatus Moranbacteria bacterium]|nr:cysteine synthase B [Candidatus Moranbacteria bacterium]
MYENVIEMIGNTPMVKINKLNPSEKVAMYAKLEGINPGGSIKDRVALKMIQKAIKDGTLTKDKTIIEATSGNTGIGIAMIGAVMGYAVEIVMSESASIERRKMIQSFGAKIILTDPGKGTDGAIIKTKELVANNPKKYFMPDQFSNVNNMAAHYETTADEICKDTGGKIDYFVSSIGTSGTIMGISKRLKELNPNIKIVCAYPERGHRIQGLKNMEEAIVPKIYDKTKIDEFIIIESEKAFAMARLLAQKEGLFVGMSSGATMLAATEIAKRINSGTVVMILPDRGEKYLSTELF